MRQRFKWYTNLMIVLALVAFFSATTWAQPGKAKEKGRLYLVSVGTGAPDNITLRAMNVIRDSEVIFCRKNTRDRFPILLEGKEIHEPGFGIFSLFAKSPEEGKKSKRFDYEEKMRELDEINSIIRNAVGAGKTVSILDNGDPTIYGPNVWYMEAFEDLHPEIVPGISSFNAANAALKKRVTSGEKTHSVILTATFGREEYTGPDSIEKLAEHQATLVFFTMFMDLADVITKLRTHYPADTPMAIVLFAGYKDKEEIIQGTLDTILEQIKGRKLPHEHLIYVGDFLTKRYKEKRNHE